MKIGTHLLAQLERCGLSAKLAEDHREVGDDSSGSRVIRQEIGRAWAARDRTHSADAHKALSWLSCSEGLVLSVNEELDLIDEDSGEVLVSGRPGAVVEMAAGEMLVVSWVIGEHFDHPEPEEDIGLLAMGLAAAKGKPFKVGHVWLMDKGPVCRRSPLYDAEAQPALWHRIRSATSRPKIACPGQWCIGCKQKVYCEAWLTRAQAAIVLAGIQVKAIKEGQIPKLDITSQTAGDLADSIKTLKAVVEIQEDQLKGAVRSGVRCVCNGKEYYEAPMNGRETADMDALRADGLTKYIKVGAPYSTFRWRNVQKLAVKAKAKS